MKPAISSNPALKPCGGAPVGIAGGSFFYRLLPPGSERVERKIVALEGFQPLLLLFLPLLKKYTDTELRVAARTFACLTGGQSDSAMTGAVYFLKLAVLGNWVDFVEKA
ncbi:hypothetical protein [Rhodoferax antarcticus]|uniref:hypothetical protein n=1 Tax=Rhodoferax antarcticus TaxID=81479 RepID=UPI0022251EBB|nr:hypothetical protein [Rhodoferax antarcticus]MCW2314324.1 hypothetical protein [Rhodoferax antarcticus]